MVTGILFQIRMQDKEHIPVAMTPKAEIMAQLCRVNLAHLIGRIVRRVPTGNPLAEATRQIHSQRRRQEEA